MSSILFSLTKKSGKSLLVFGLPLVAAMATTHAFVPPTPGPAYVAYNLGVDLGTMILWGVVVGLPTAIVAAIVGRRMGEKFYVPVPPELDTGEEKARIGAAGFRPGGGDHRPADRAHPGRHGESSVSWWPGTFRRD